jgi:hypothetical protein
MRQPLGRLAGRDACSPSQRHSPSSPRLRYTHSLTSL